MALNINIGAKLKDVKSVQSDIQAQLEKISSKLGIQIDKIKIANITNNAINAPKPNAANKPVTAPITTPNKKVNITDNIKIITSTQHFLFLPFSQGSNDGSIIYSTSLEHFI